MEEHTQNTNEQNTDVQNTAVANTNTSQAETQSPAPQNEVSQNEVSQTSSPTETSQSERQNVDSESQNSESPREGGTREHSSEHSEGFKDGAGGNRFGNKPYNNNNNKFGPRKNYQHRDDDGDRSDYGGRRGDFSKDREMRRNKYKKHDKIAAKKLDIDYKKPEILKEFLTEKGKILSRLITGSSSQNQHKLAREVKRARYIGLLPSA